MRIRPLGLLKQPDGSEPETRKANPLLSLRCRIVLANERVTRRVTAPFAALFAPPIVVAVITSFALLVGWLLFSEGFAASTRQVLYQPALVLMMFGLASASAGFHEFGHAAALAYSGGTPGVIGAGLYLVWPAFYTNVTDSYRLSRSGRLRTDLGGLYFNMVFALATFGVWAITHFDAVLLVIPVLLLQMIQQLLPVVRLDGYHILADLTGVPDLFGRIRPTLQSLKPGSDPDPRVTALKPWVRVVVTAWVLAVIPLLALSVLFGVIQMPRLAATAWDSLTLQWQSIGVARRNGELLAILAGGLSIVALCLPVLSSVYMVGRLSRRSVRAAWVATRNRPVLRAVAGVAAVVAIGGLVSLWWPNGEYRPYQPGDRARLQDTIRATKALPTGRPGLTEADAARLDGAPFRSQVATEPAPAPAPADMQPTPTTVTAVPTTGSQRPGSSTTTTPVGTGSTTTTAPTTSTTAERPTTSTTTPASTTSTSQLTTESTQP